MLEIVGNPLQSNLNYPEFFIIPTCLSGPIFYESQSFKNEICNNSFPSNQADALKQFQ